MDQADFDTTSGTDALTAYLNDLDKLTVGELWDRLIGRDWTVPEFCAYANDIGSTPLKALSDAIDRGPWASMPDELRNQCFHRLADLLPCGYATEPAYLASPVPPTASPLGDVVEQGQALGGEVSDV